MRVLRAGSGRTAFAASSWARSPNRSRAGQLDPTEHRVADHDPEGALVGVIGRVGRVPPCAARPSSSSSRSFASGSVSASHSSSSEESVWRTVSPSHSNRSSNCSLRCAAGHRLPQGAVGVGQVAQHQPLGAGQLVGGDELGEGHRPLVHVAHDRLGRQRRLATPTGGSAGRSRRSPRAGRRSGFGQVTSSSSAIRSSYSTPSAFISATASPRALNCWAISTWRGSSRIASMTETTSRAWVGDSGSRTSNAARASGASGWLRAKSSCSSAAHLDRAAVGLGRRDPLQHTGVQQAPAQGDRSPGQPGLAAGCLVVVAQQVAERPHRVARALDDVEDHRVVDPHAGDQRLGVGGDELVVGLLGPRDLAVGGLAALDLLELLGVVARLGDRPGRCR